MYIQIGYNTDHCVLSSHQFSNEGEDMKKAVSPMTERELIISGSVCVSPLCCFKQRKLLKKSSGWTTLTRNEISAKGQANTGKISTLYLTHSQN